MGPEIASYLAAAAAMAAVVISVINVRLTARLSRISELERWRRDHLYQLCTEFHLISERREQRAEAAKSEASIFQRGVGEGMSDPWLEERDARLRVEADQVYELRDQMLIAFSTLELISGGGLADAGRELLTAHEDMERLMSHGDEARDLAVRPGVGYTEYRMALRTHQEGFRRAVRRELGKSG